MSQVPPPASIAPPPPLADEGPPPRAEVKWNGWDILMVFMTSVAFGGLASVGLFLALSRLDLGLNNAATIGIVGVVIYAAVLIAGWLFVHKRRDASAAEMGFKWVGAGPLLIAIPATIGLMLATFVILLGIQELVGGVPSGEEQLGLNGASVNAGDLVWLLLAGAVAAPIAEEFFFRGLLFRYLRARGSLWRAVLVSSAIFAVFHFTPLLMPALFVFGIVQALLIERYDSLYPPILLHALNNGILVVAVYDALA